MTFTLWELPPFLGVLLSIACCTWLLCRVREVPPKFASRLLLRQLVHLSIADISAAVASMAMSAMLLLFPETFVRILCNHNNWRYGPWFFIVYGQTVSVLVEAQLALGLVADARRWFGLSKCLDRCMAFNWFLALVFAVGDMVFTYSAYWDDLHLCVWSVKVGSHTTIGAPFLHIAGSFLMFCNLISYMLLMGCCQQELLPRTVEQKARTQAFRYLFVALVTWVPYWFVCVMYWVDAKHPERLPGWKYVVLCTTGVTLNGALNVWAYAMHNRHLKRLEEAEAKDPSATDWKPSPHVDSSFHVAFNREVLVLDGSQIDQHRLSLSSEESSDSSERRFVVHNPRFVVHNP